MYYRPTQINVELVVCTIFKKCFNYYSKAVLLNFPLIKKLENCFEH